ncbi:MAG: hypothetical protein H7X84_05385 [Verrucomicrobia bacterium]|nr:hypothetical protein [Prolixibacteraceae bacterium]
MKEILCRLIICVCLSGAMVVSCYGSSSYTVQVVASKSPTDVKWFSSKYQIEEKMLEIHENSWYKYVIGEFNTVHEASVYISENLSPKGLKDAFPRILPDSLKPEPIPSTQLTVPTSDAVEIKTVDSIPAVNPLSVNSSVNQSAVNSYRDFEKGYEKYGPWIELIGKENLYAFEKAMIDGGKQYLPRSFVPSYERMMDNALRYPVVMFFIMLIILFVLNAAVIIVILELSNNIKNTLQRYDVTYTKMYERALTGYIFQEYDLDSTVGRIKGIRHSRNRRIFIAVLFNFKQNLSGDLEQKLLDIFFKLGLEKKSMGKTQSYSFYGRILGMRELTNLHPSGAFPIVESYINHENDELRAEAQTSYVRLNHEEPFRFLKDLRKPFTRWTQLTSFYIFRLHKLPAPSFVEYLKSDLYNVQNFSLRMIIYFQQKENALEIIKLLHAKREMTRFLAIRAVNELGIQEAKPLLKEVYEKETYKNRIEIIKGFLHMGNSDDLNFLENIITQKDVSLKIEACRSMYFMNSLGMEYLKNLKSKQELNIESYIAHIHDPRN